VKAIAARGIPIVHRKTGYKGRGGPEMHRIVDGVVWGDTLQVGFDPWVTHSVFQSGYSRDVFLQSGCRSEYTVVHNGVDERVFSPDLPARWFGLRSARRRAYWDGRSRLRVIVSTWSNNYNKGFHDYLAIDRQLRDRDDVEMWLVGRVPPDAAFRQVRLFTPRGPRLLAALLRQAHVILQLSVDDTCSNALIEALNCGLPAIYLDSGSHREIAGPYGVEYRGDWWASVAAVKAAYAQLVERLSTNPFRISMVGPQYLRILQQAIAKPKPCAA